MSIASHLTPDQWDMVKIGLVAILAIAFIVGKIFEDMGK